MQRKRDRSAHYGCAIGPSQDGFLGRMEQELRAQVSEDEEGKDGDFAVQVVGLAPKVVMVRLRMDGRLVDEKREGERETRRMGG